MRIVILGATGATGRHVVEQALDAGHEVIAYVRNAAKVTTHHPRLRVVEGSLADRVRLHDAMTGADAVISALGVTRATRDAQPSTELPAVLDAMRAAGVVRYVGLSSGAAVDLLDDHKPLPARIVGRLLKTFRKASVEDKQRELELLCQRTDITWTLARPPRLLGDSLTRAYAVDLHRPRRLWVSRADVAHFLLSQVADTRWSRQAPFVA